MPIDREGALRQAEKLLRQGKLDGAIAEYVRLVQDYPRDWTSINALGDLYVRAGNRDRAVAQFTQIADFMFGEGFLPKASALYKKALKVVPDHEHTLLRLSEIASRQGVLVDARTYLRHLDRLRRGRGDARGAADIAIRLALLDEADAEARLSGARSAREIGDTARAVALFKAAAEQLTLAGRQQEALDALSEAATLDPKDHDLRRHLAREAVAAGDLARAHTFLTRESAGTDPDLLLALGRLDLASGRDADARAAFTRLITVAPDRSGALLDLERALAHEGALEGAFTCAQVLVDDAVLAGDWNRAFDALRIFLDHASHIPALVMLVELAVDAQRDDVMQEAQARLADAYVAAGRGAEARVIAEDLLARNPQSEAHADRLRQALGLLGVDDAEATIARYRDRAGVDGDPFDLDGVAFDFGDDRGAAATAVSEDVEESGDVDLSAALDSADVLIEEESPDSFVLDAVEIDLTEALAGLAAASPILPPAPATSTEERREGVPDDREEPVNSPADLESVFEAMRTRARQEGDDGREPYDRALQQLEQGQIADAVTGFRAAARTPLYRFRASARLGRLYLACGDVREGIEWLERAAEAPPPTADEGWAVLYDLGAVLEQVGERARALAVFMELEADAASYRDVHARVEHLSRARAGKA